MHGHTYDIASAWAHVGAMHSFETFMMWKRRSESDMNITIPCTFSNFLTNQNLSKTSLVFWHIMTVVINHIE